MNVVREKRYHCGEKYMEVDIYQYADYQPRRGNKRSRKKKESLLSQKNINDKNASRALNRLIETNFIENDLHVTLTYNDKYLPKTVEEAEKNVTNYIRRIKRKRKSKDIEDLKYIVITSFREKNNDGEIEMVRMHHHIIMNQGLERDDVEKLWRVKPKGKPYEQLGYANADRLQANANSGFAAISKYLVKQESNKRRWTSSQNLDRPETRTNDHKYSRRKLLSLVNHNAPFDYWERIYPGWYIADKDYGYEEVYNDITGWAIYLKLRKKE